MSKEQSLSSPTPAMASPPGANVFLTLLPITLAVFIGFLTIGMQMPVLPLHLHETLGMGTLVIGSVIGLQFVVALLSRPWAGNLADLRGAKRAVVIGCSQPAPAWSIWHRWPSSPHRLPRYGSWCWGASCWPWAKA